MAAEFGVRFQNDGTLWIEGSGGRVVRAFPGLDGRPLRPLEVNTGTGPDGISWAQYRTDEVTLRLTIRPEGPAFRIGTEVLALTVPAAELSPLFEAEVEGVRGFFVQNLGLRGDYGYLDRATVDCKASGTESQGLCALHLPGGHLALAVHEHDRFLARFRLVPAGLGTAPHRLSFSFALERTRTGAFRLPDLHVTVGEDLGSLLSDAAGRIAAAMGARPARNPSYFWCSWYHRFNYMDLSTLDAYLAEFVPLRDRFPLQTIQIDAGYCATPGDWLVPNAQWPGGMGEAFRRIEDAGFRPGIWVAPFIVGNLSRLYTEHPDWVLHGPDGRPIAEKTFYEWRKPWPNPDTEYFILDVSHPDALAYILGVFREMRALGARMFKTDFLLWHFRETHTVRRHDPSRTSVELFRTLLSGIREAIGEDSYWLGCIAPFLPSIGYADGMRIGGDVFSTWSTVHMTNLARKVAGSNHFNRVWFENDPDVLVLRDFDTELSAREVHAVSLFQALSGGMVGTSDPLHRLAPDRQELFRFVRPEGPAKPHFPYLDQRRDDVVLTYADPERDRYLFFVFNPGDASVVKRYTTRGVFPGDASPGPLYLSEWIGREIGETAVEDFYLEILPHGAKLFYGSRTAPVRAFPDRLRWGMDR